MKTPERIRVVLVDDQAMVRTGLRMILEAEGDIDVVGEASNGEEAIHVVAAARPHVVLMDVQMPVLDGLRATAQLLHGHTDPHPPRVMMLTTFERDDYLFEALRAGASGFLLKNAPPEELIRGVRVAADGDAMLSPSVTQRLVREIALRPRLDDARVALSGLTDREQEVLIEIARGHTNAEIARLLVIGEETVKSHVSNLLAKIGVRDRTHAIIYAYEHGVVTPGASP